MKKRGKFVSFLIRLKFSAAMALHGITSNMLRTFLTVLGISIGVAAVVSLMGIGEGARQTVVEQFESLGQNVIIMKASNPEYYFEDDDVEELTDRIQGIDYATPVTYGDVPIRWRRTDTNLSFVGTNDKYPEIRDHKVVSGNFFTSLHVKMRSPVCVLGYNVAVKLMSGRSPVGQTIKVNGINYRILGVLAKKGDGNGDGIDDKIVIPYTSSMKILTDRSLKEVWAKCDTDEDVSLALVQLGRIYNRKINGTQLTNSSDASGGDVGDDGGLIDGDISVETDDSISEDDSSASLTDEELPITITSLNSLVDQANKANQVMTLLLGGIAAVSLLVGGIGIMNIMLVAVTERTSEIGVRKALGAKQLDLLIQFLLEAVYVSIIGCIVGIVLGTLAINLANQYGLPAVISASSVKVAVTVAITSGLVFGVYPAVNASALEPVEALQRQ